MYNAYASAQGLALVGIGFIGQLYDAHDASIQPATGLVDAARRKALAEPILKDLVSVRDLPEGAPRPP